ncbi:signal peptidase I [Breznakiella homolactica]|uniref:Signal peptidase I n=1 Tax=Breznakiella homolactica TaxID=2798577 RepID=A0A7T7XKH5_9SPIR|nr:signal peptidase I [Breznakiella homolactica]QQO07975.1 signal peptidase I [Breznakiella homolactica]
MEAKTDFFDRLQGITELYLTRRRRIRRIKKEKQKRKNVILDWVEAFLWAAAVVLLINQYLFQAYQIPSGSMIDTLLISDRIFVNKLIYGPELLPGIGKIPSPVKPKRNDIIIFENPSYISRGPVFDIAQRIIYMLTLSFVDIDRDENGEPKAHFLIKRAVGMGGDHFTSEKGELSVRFSGEDRWVTEREYMAGRNMVHNISRLIQPDEYTALEAAGKLYAYAELWLEPPRELIQQASPVLSFKTVTGSAGRDEFELQPKYRGDFSYSASYMAFLKSAYPHDPRYGAYLARHVQGWYIPEGRIFPLGDNRDNSRDGRYFGPVQEYKVLGKGAFIYWPLDRMGPIR